MGLPGTLEPGHLCRGLATGLCRSWGAWGSPGLAPVPGLPPHPQHFRFAVQVEVPRTGGAVPG